MTFERADPAPGVVVWQPTRGFRYTSDAFWLAGFALEPGVPERAIDLGTGSGIVAFLLASAGASVLGVDDAPHWAEGWARSSSERGAVALRTADVRALAEAPAPLVAANPPYFPRGTGPVAADPLRAAARTESSATLADFVACARRHLAPGGTAAFVVPADRVAELGADEVVVVGRRALCRLGGDPRPTVALPPDDPRVLGWYRRFGASPPRPGRPPGDTPSR